MADLAKVDKPIGARRRGSDNRDFTLPSRRQTDTARLEVNAQIVGKSQSDARDLQAILGLAQDAGDAAVGFLEQRDQQHRASDRSAGSLASSSGNVDEERLANSRAYAQGYYVTGAQRTVIELHDRALEAVQQRLYNEDDPATLEDVNKTLNDLFASYALNEDGTPRNFGDPLAARAMAEGLSKIRAEILPTAVDYIRKQQNEKLASNTAFVLVNGGMPEIFGGAETPLGSPRVPKPGDVRTIEVPPSTAAEGHLSQPRTSTPAAPAGTVTLSALASSVEWAESRGNPGAVSPKGARGRMQTMPGTLAAPGYGVAPAKDNSDAELTRVGKDYLQAMMREYGGDTVLALAAYNAGPGRTNEWREKLGTGTLEQRIARIPFKETRDYVSAVLHHAGAPMDAQDGSFVEPGANEDPNLRDRLFQGPVEVAPPVVDFETIMAKRPPSISPGDWKAYMVPAIIENAEIAKKPEILEGLWRSTRADGTPSFNPEEIGKIRDAAERIRETRRVEAKRAQQDRWEANGDLVLGEIVAGRDPSDDTIRNMVDQGQLDPQFGYTVLEHRQNEREQAVREQKAEDRQARADADRELDLDLATLQMERAAGIGPHDTYQDDLTRFRNGDFGTGKAAVRRFRQARAAAAEGIKRVEESEEGRRIATMLDETFPRQSTRDTGRMIDRANGPVSNLNRTMALSHYHSQLEAGKSPQEAFDSAVRLYGSKPGQGGDAALRARQAELRARQAPTVQ